jgi:cyclin-dependent kinase 8/11
VKVVYGPRGGRTIGSIPHDVGKEVMILKRSIHPNVRLPKILPLIRLIYKIVSLSDYEYKEESHEHHLYLPFLPISLSDLLPSALPSDLIQSIIFQSLLALAHLHENGIAHRDINPNNIMIDWNGSIQLIDFGIAWTGGDDVSPGERVWTETRNEMICDVGTGWVRLSWCKMKLMNRRWRAPELLFSPTTYDAFALDLWALGVIITDMFDHVFPPPADPDEDVDEDEDERDPLENEQPTRPTRAGKGLFDDNFGDIGLAGSIFRILGTPTEESWPVSHPHRIHKPEADVKQEFESLPDAGKIEFIPTIPQSLTSILPTMNDQLLDLTSRLLQLSPSRRISARKALEHAYFDNTLVPSSSDTWYGSEARIDCSPRCVEFKDGRRLVDYFADLLEQKRGLLAEWKDEPSPR